MANDIGVSAEAVREAFIADAAADAELVVRVGELLTAFSEFKERAEATYKSLVDVYAAAEGRPNAAAKLVELGFPRPDDLGVDLGVTRRNANGKRSVGGRRRARTGTEGKQRTDDQQQPEDDAVDCTAAALAAQESGEVDPERSVTAAT
jgi:hypothetical protein